ncbi:cytochrome c [Hyphomonas sp.]|uniref:c-type cytochrome n=1 Tax=Hyphomonas sp. TaxID=87 RepID=UPI0035284B56
MTRQTGALGILALLMSLLGACGSTPTDAMAAETSPLADTGSAAVLALACSGCHSPAGGAIASLEGRTSTELRTALLRYRTDPDGGSVMHRMMRGYSEADIDAISVYLAEDIAE